MREDYQQLKSELGSELKNIINYWSQNTIDKKYGGFVGRINHDNEIIPKASKGIILNTRILWSFSAASNHLKTQEYKTVCERAYSYLKSFFNDNTYKGVFWELDYYGKPINKRKQVYAQAFAIYALSEYYILSKRNEVKNWAIELYNYLENYAKDEDNKGYFEAFTEKWSPIDDMRLSDKDMYAAKTMNTHLHVLEAYTSLLRIYDNDDLRRSLKSLIEIFQEKFLNDQNHYDLFFDEQWNLLSNSVSYGHDIETAWLVIEASKLTGEEDLLRQAEKTAIRVANTFLKEGIDEDGAVINEKNIATSSIDTDRHWWPQVEALIGLKYVFDLKKEPKYIKSSLRIWDFTKKHLIDDKNGEWFFRVDKSGNVYTQEDKVSMWKAPYHTTRACIKLNS